MKPELILIIANLFLSLLNLFLAVDNKNQRRLKVSLLNVFVSGVCFSAAMSLIIKNL